MKLDVHRYVLRITPESESDEAYLEEVLGLRQDGDSVRLTRSNAIGLNRWAYAETAIDREDGAE